MTGERRGRLRRDDRGSTIPLMIGFFILAGLMLTGGVVASSAFVQLRSLQSACDGAAVAAANGFGRGESTLSADLPMDDQSAQFSALAYADQAWGSDARLVTLEVSVVGNQVNVRCTKVAHVPFEAIVAPGGIRQSVLATSRAPLIG